MRGTITDVAGVKVGHFTEKEARTGCTVVLLPANSRGGVVVSGSAPATRETAVLEPSSWVEDVHAICLAGGSAYGLQAAGGVMRWLEARGQGHPTRFGPVPIVPAACIYDLNVGDGTVRPDEEAGYDACERASTDFPTGQVGAGTGATCGKWRGIERACPAGIGTASRRVEDLVVGCLAVVSPIGDIVGRDGRVLLGVGGDPTGALSPGMPNTILCVVATTGCLTRDMCTRAASRIPDGIARAVNPAHTLHDGDTGFFVSCGAVDADPDVIFHLTMEVVADAIRSVARKQERT